MSRTIPFEQRYSCTVREAEEAIGLGHTKVSQLIADGKLESIKVGGRRLVIVRSIMELGKTDAAA